MTCTDRYIRDIVSAKFRSMAGSYVMVGSGDHRVIALHGWFGSALGWGHLTDYLNTAQFTYVFPDLRGYGSPPGQPRGGPEGPGGPPPHPGPPTPPPGGVAVGRGARRRYRARRPPRVGAVQPGRPLDERRGDPARPRPGAAPGAAP